MFNSLNTYRTCFQAEFPYYHPPTNLMQTFGKMMMMRAIGNYRSGGPSPFLFHSTPLFVHSSKLGAQKNGPNGRRNRTHFFSLELPQLHFGLLC